MTQEALKLALDALECALSDHRPYIVQCKEAITAIKEALAQPDQEPVAWQTMEAKYPTLEKLDIRMGDGSILCSVWPQSDGDLWWEGSGTGEKFIDPKYANVTHWRVHSDTNPPQRTWQGLMDEEIQTIVNMVATGTYQTSDTFARAIEAKLKQKNGYVAQETNS